MEIGDNGKFDMDSQVFSISQELQEGPGEDLFDYIAECLYNFSVSRNINSEILPLGFTFSFPCEQVGLDVGRLIKWTKGFKCSGVEKQVTCAKLLWNIK